MISLSRCLPPEGTGTKYVSVTQGILFINCNGRKTRQLLIERALRMSPRPPDFICLVEANTWRWEPPAEWEDYTRVAHNWQDLLSNKGIEVCKHKNCPYAGRTVAASAQGDALLIQVYTQETNYGIAVVHAPHAKKVGVPHVLARLLGQGQAAGRPQKGDCGRGRELRFPSQRQSRTTTR